MGNRWGNNGNSERLFSWAPNSLLMVTAAMKLGRFLLGRKAMTNLDSILKSRDITLPTKVCLVKAMVFPIVMYGCESWTIKKAEHWRTDSFQLWCWRKLLRVPWTAWISNQSVLREINPEYSLEGLMLKPKLRYFGHLMWRANSLEKTLSQIGLSLWTTANLVFPYACSPYATNGKNVLNVCKRDFLILAVGGIS